MNGLLASGCFTNDGVAQLSCIPPLITAAANTFLVFAGSICLFLVMWGAIQLILSGGDAKKVSGARSIITYAIIGLIVVLSSFSIVYFIGYLTKTQDSITNPCAILPDPDNCK